MKIIHRPLFDFYPHSLWCRQVSLVKVKVRNRWSRLITEASLHIFSLLVNYVVSFIPAIRRADASLLVAFNHGLTRRCRIVSNVASVSGRGTRWPSDRWWVTGHRTVASGGQSICPSDSVVDCDSPVTKTAQQESNRLTCRRRPRQRRAEKSIDPTYWLVTELLPVLSAAAAASHETYDELDEDDAPAHFNYNKTSQSN